MHHAGTENGELVVTFDNFEAFGVTRRAIAPAIAVAVALGFIDVTVKGIKSHGAARRSSKYAITWLPRNDGTSAGNRWKSISTKQQAEATVAAVYLGKKESNGSGTRLQWRHAESAPLTPSGDIRSSVLNATGAQSRKFPIPQ